MDWAWVLFGLLLAMCVAMGAAFVIEEAPKEVSGAGETTYLGHGTVHEQYSTMQVGGDGEARHGTILWVGWAFGFLQCLFFVACLIFGSRKNGSAGPMTKPLLIGGAVYAGVFTAMIVSYDRFVALGADIPLFLSFPRPTAWMIYGIWGFPLYFLVVYLVTFDRWTCRPEDIEEFRRIIGKSAEKTRGAGETV
jgi:hypothetical protein